MPRNVRNFWLTLKVDGKKTDVATGPRARSGGFRCHVLMRSEGAIYDKEVVLEGIVSDGLLELKLWDGGDVVFKRTTKP